MTASAPAWRPATTSAVKSGWANDTCASWTIRRPASGAKAAMTSRLAAQRQGWKPVFSGSFAFDTQDAERAGADAEGLLAFSGTVNFSGSERMADYRAAVARFVPGGVLGGPGAHAWAQGRLLQAATRSLPDQVTSAVIAAGLLGLHGENLGGIVPPLTFPDGPHRDVNRCIVPIRLAGGRWTQPLGHEFVCS